MTLVADSGATKTDWRLLEADGTITQFQSMGINPYLRKSEDIHSEITATLKPKIKSVIHNLYFYGAGCSSPENASMLHVLFKTIFPEAQVYVENDLLGAARALCGRTSGIACILGTGSNSCYYDGQNIKLNVPGLGYVLGDEGSGAWLGTRLLALYMREDLPSSIAQRLEKRFKLTREGIFDNVYQKPMPSRYLAGFSTFIFQNIKNPVLYRLVYEGFELFFKKNVEKYENCKQLPVHFTGSIAFYYSNILRQVANDRGISVKNIVENPIAGLTLYHQKTTL